MNDKETPLINAIKRARTVKEETTIRNAGDFVVASPVGLCAALEEEPTVKFALTLLKKGNNS